MQTFLVIGALMLLSTFTVNFYRTNLDQTSFSYRNEATVTGSGIGQSLIEEISNKAFDETTVLAPVRSADSLTSAFSLGRDGSETTSNTFDDVDDYNTYVRAMPTARLGDFNVKVSVYYVNQSDFTSSLSQTFSKQVDVCVFNSYMNDTLRISSIISY